MRSSIFTSSLALAIGFQEVFSVGKIAIAKEVPKTTIGIV